MISLKLIMGCSKIEAGIVFLRNSAGQGERLKKKRNYRWSQIEIFISFFKT
jgi:hypothetical protein